VVFEFVGAISHGTEKADDADCQKAGDVCDTDKGSRYGR
jgi:hypothetical protein